MTYLLNIDQAIDRKYLVTKSLKGQAAAGNIIHVMDAESKPNSVVVNYRVNHFNQKFMDYQDFSVKFRDVSEFCKWAQPDNFIARNYENLDKEQNIFQLLPAHYPCNCYHSHDSKHTAS